MKIKSLTNALLFLFLTPSLVFTYFAYLYVQNEHALQKKVNEFHDSVQIIHLLSDLVYNLQLERGLSTGYIITKNNQQKKDLNRQYLHTDKVYNKCLILLNKKHLYDSFTTNNQRTYSKLLQYFKNLNKIRNSVQNNTIEFKSIIAYYSKINSLLMIVIENLNSQFTFFHGNNFSINLLLQLQENAGLERAYIYHILLSKNPVEKSLFAIRNLLQERKKLQEKLFLSTSEKFLSLYKKLYNKKLEEQVTYCSSNILHNNITKLHPQKCFHASTQYINMLHKIYQHIFSYYLNKATELQHQSQKKLYFANLMVFISFAFIGFIFYMFVKLIKNEEKNKIDLQIAAYTFEAQEGVVITDAQGVIQKVNKSFSTITGYTSQEAIGNTPRILKSDQHPESFYENIWKKLKKEGKWQGEIINKRKDERLYTEMLSITAIKNKMDKVTHYIAQFFDISEMKKAQIALQHQIDHDFLSGLLSRTALLQRLRETLAKAKRHKNKHAFLFIDLDNFKNINDTYGHNIGDKLIQEVAKRLKRILREEDIIARISGDEFGVLITELEKDTNEVATIAQKILQEISKEILLENYSIKISSSIGIKLFSFLDTSYDKIIQEADSAMYKAKKAGKNSYRFFRE